MLHIDYFKYLERQSKRMHKDTPTTHKNWKLISPLTSIELAQMGLVVKQLFRTLNSSLFDIMKCAMIIELKIQFGYTVYVWKYSKIRQKPTDVHGWPVSTSHLHSPHFVFKQETGMLYGRERWYTVSVCVCLSVRAYKVNYLWADKRKCHGLCAKQKPYWQNGKKKTRKG